MIYVVFTLNLNLLDICHPLLQRLFVMMKFFPALLILIFSVVDAHSLERFDIITTQQLNEMLVERAQGNTDFILINTLDKIIADHHAIPGSINIPWSQMYASGNILGNDKDKEIVTYCMGYR